MDVVLLTIVALVAVLFFLVLVLKGTFSTAKPLYEAAGPLLTPAERAFYGVLRQALPDGYVLTFKVRIGDVLKVRKGLDKKQTFILRSKIQQKHFDFVICKQNDLRVVCCVELNDASHNRPERAKRDAFVRSACKAAKVPLLEVKARRSYALNELRAQLLPILLGRLKAA